MRPILLGLVSSAIGWSVDVRDYLPRGVRIMEFLNFFGLGLFATVNCMEMWVGPNWPVVRTKMEKGQKRNDRKNSKK